MARIRTVKPEFWSSPSMRGADPWARLLFIAMWNWADDTGRGTANVRELAAFAFPDEDDPIAPTTTELPSLLSEVRDRWDVEFYEVRGRRYYAIPSFDRHQRNERRANSRHPGPEQGEPYDPGPPDQGKRVSGRSVTDVPMHSDGSSVASGGRSVTGTGEQGNRGTGEQGNKNDAPLRSASSAQLAVVDGGTVAPVEPPITAQAAVQTWHDAYTATHDAKPTRQQLGQVGREANQLIKAGNPPERVVAACRSAGSRGFATVQREYADLASRSTRARPAPPRGSTTDARVQAGLELASKYDRMEAG